MSFASGLAEGVGLAVLLPLLALATGEASATPAAALRIEEALAALAIPATLPSLLVLVVVALFAKAGLQLLAAWQAGTATAQVARDLRLHLITAIMRAQWSYYVRQPTGRLANAVASEAARASGLFVKAVDLLTSTFMLVIYVGLAVTVSWRIALLSLAVGGAILLAVRRLVAVAARAGREQTTLMRSLIGRLTDGLYAIKPLKAMGREDALQPALERETEELNAAQRRQVLSVASMGVVYEPAVALALAGLAYVLLALLAVPFAEVLFLALLLQRTVGKVGAVQRHYQTIATIESALWSLEESIEAAEAAAEPPYDRGPIPTLNHAVALDDVTFSYGGAPVLRRFSVTIPRGRLTALVGPTGGGKTTVIDLVTGLYRPDDGQVLVDDLPLATANVAAWRRKIGYVPQEVVLFHDTVRANVAMHDPTLRDEDVERALADAGASEFVARLPHGLDTVIGEHGARLSGGQRQRLSLARALVHQPELLVLDEATTGLDPATEQAVLATLRRLLGDLTVLAVSHQRGVIEAADHVHEVQPLLSGAVEESG